MYRLIYKSRANTPLNWGIVEKILHQSVEHNKALGVGGVLLASETHYLQILEGKFESVNKIFMQIARDARHNDLQLISFHPIDGVLFHTWGMRGVGVMGINNEIKDQLIKKYGEEDNGVKFPLEEWLVLSMLKDIDMIDGIPTWKEPDNL